MSADAQTSDTGQSSQGIQPETSQPQSTPPPPPQLDIDSATSAIQQLLDESPFDNLHTLIEATLNDSHQHKALQRELFLTHAPTLLSLHDSLIHSISSLDSLSTFLSTFSTDLGSVSHQIATLKEKSKRIEEQLTAKRQLEEPLDRLLGTGGIVLDPQVVDKIFDTPVDQSWKPAIVHLEKTIEATRRPLDQLAAIKSPRRRTSSALNGSFDNAADDDETSYKALVEAREVADACKIMTATKIRPFLISPFSLLRKSVTTNLQILQTSILLPHHAPLYGFLARQMPRVAIDVQRAYVSAARLHFETGFRRYARSLNTIAKRGYAADTGGSGSIADLGRGLLGGPSAGQADAWLTSTDRLEHANFEGPGVTLGYQADDGKYQASPEALYRSLALVFFDNACSEFTFLVRYFEAMPLRKTKASRASQGAARSVLSPGSSIPPTPISELSEGEASGDVTQDEEGPAPSESASAAVEEEETTTKQGDLVQLSKSEKHALKGRGGSSELFKKIFEPVTNTWLNFSRSLLSGSYATLPLIPLMCMILLTDQLLSLANIRGVEDVLMGPLLQFKMEAWPLFQKRFQEEIDSIQSLAGGGSDAGAGSTMSGWMKSATALATGKGSSLSSLTEGNLQTIATRYASFYSQICHLTSKGLSMDQVGSGADAGGSGLDSSSSSSSSSSIMLFSSLSRMRTAIETVLEKKISTEGAATGKTLRSSVAKTVVRALDDGVASASIGRIQMERSHWDELSKR